MLPHVSNLDEGRRCSLCIGAVVSKMQVHKHQLTFDKITSTLSAADLYPSATPTKHCAASMVELYARGLFEISSPSVSVQASS